MKNDLGATKSCVNFNKECFGDGGGGSRGGGGGGGSSAINGVSLANMSMYNMLHGTGGPNSSIATSASFDNGGPSNYHIANGSSNSGTHQQQQQQHLTHLQHHLNQHYQAQQSSPATTTTTTTTTASKLLGAEFKQYQAKQQSQQSQQQRKNANFNDTSHFHPITATSAAPMKNGIKLVKDEEEADKEVEIIHEQGKNRIKIEKIVF